MNLVLCVGCFSFFLSFFVFLVVFLAFFFFFFSLLHPRGGDPVHQLLFQFVVVNPVFFFKLIACGLQWYVERRRWVQAFAFSSVFSLAGNGNVDAIFIRRLRCLNVKKEKDKNKKKEQKRNGTTTTTNKNKTNKKKRKEKLL